MSGVVEYSRLNGPSDGAKMLDGIMIVPFRSRPRKEQARILLAIRDNAKDKGEQALFFDALGITLPISVLSGLAKMHG